MTSTQKSFFLVLCLSCALPGTMSAATPFDAAPVSVSPSETGANAGAPTPTTPLPMASDGGSTAEGATLSSPAAQALRHNIDFAYACCEEGKIELAWKALAECDNELTRNQALIRFFGAEVDVLRAQLLQCSTTGMQVPAGHTYARYASGTTPAQPADPNAAPGVTPSEPTKPTADALTNEVRFGINRVRQKIAAKDPTLAASITWLKQRIADLKARNNPGDSGLILEAISAERDAQKVLAQLAPAPGTISETGRQQMASVVTYARNNHRGASDGYCFNAVWGYLSTCGYGKINAWGDLPGMGSGEARFFSEYMNASKAHLDEAGLQRLDTALTPPITNPHDDRIPVGAVIVVAAGSYGTYHKTAGDIVIKVGPSHFINDGPNMDYGTRNTWYGKVLGVYVPR